MPDSTPSSLYPNESYLDSAISALTCNTQKPALSLNIPKAIQILSLPLPTTNKEKSKSVKLKIPDEILQFRREVKMFLQRGLKGDIKITASGDVYKGEISGNLAHGLGV